MKLRCRLWFWSFLVALASPASSWANDVARLRAFVEATSSARAQFVQTVYDRHGRTRQEASGVMMFQRPGRFRWAYEKPHAQLIVGDGQRLWIYDKDLAQVSVKPLQEALGASPAALLAGNNEIERLFDLSAAGRRDGLDWLEARPRGKETSFERILMGFEGEKLRAMEFADAFGNRTLIRFERFEANPRLNADLFRFVPPPGVDVVGE